MLLSYSLFIFVVSFVFCLLHMFKAHYLNLFIFKINHLVLFTGVYRKPQAGINDMLSSVYLIGWNIVYKCMHFFSAVILFIICLSWECVLRKTKYI